MKANLTLDSKEDTISELELYKKVGGGTICDIAPKGLRLDTVQLQLMIWVLRKPYILLC